MADVTLDSISLRGAGIVHILQHKRGARFTLDSILLADFCRIKHGARLLEPGTGTGIVSILLAKKFKNTKVAAVDVQPSLVELARKNVERNGLSRSITVHERDILTITRAFKAAPYDGIVANPPYTHAGAGRRSPIRERQTSRQDHRGIQVWLDLQSLLKNKGRYFLIFPASRSAELIFLLKARRLEPKRIRFIHPYQTHPASLVLIEAVKEAAPGIEIIAPLFIHDKGGSYSPEMSEIYSVPAGHENS